MPEKPGNAAKGKTIFDNPQGVGCIKCHAVSGTGGKVGPDLVGIGARYPKDELIRSILDLQEKIQRTGTIDAREFASRTAYEGPTALAKELAPEDAIVAPGDYNTATRLRSLPVVR